MRKTAYPVVWEGGGAQSPSPDPIKKAKRCAISLKAVPLDHGLKAVPLMGAAGRPKAQAADLSGGRPQPTGIHGAVLG
jgi:hypothetical protein